MAQYSIRDLEKLTGIKAHTLRIWEKRYNVIQPERTETNNRFYTDNDLKKLLNISILNRHGVKISHISQKSDKELSREIEKLSNSDENYDSLVEGLVVAMIELEEMKFEKIFTNAVIKHGFEDTMGKVIYPFLDKVGMLWQIGTIHPAQEHFISNLIRQKLIVAVDGVSVEYNSNAQKFILFLPEGELHEFGLLFYHYMLRKRGFKVIYLGQTVPYCDLKAIMEKEQNFSVITSFITHKPLEEIRDYIIRLSNDANQQEIYVIGRFSDQIRNSLPHNIHLIKSVPDFKSIMNW